MTGKTALSRAIDDVLDYAYSTLNEMEILKVHPTLYMQRIAALLRDAADRGDEAANVIADIVVKIT